MKTPARPGLLLVSLVLATPVGAQQPVLQSPSRGFDAGTFSTAASPWAARVADLDADGDIDVATANWCFDSQLAVPQNDGTALVAANGIVATIP